VIVKVIDRGPYVKGRVIDLSHRAARELGIIAQGIAPVIVEEFTESVIPFKPAEIFSKPELDLSTSDGDAATPIWVELNQQMKLKKQQEHKEKKKR
jgi:rare lipoprotein A